MDLNDLVPFRHACVLLGVSTTTANRKLAIDSPDLPRPIWIDRRRFFSLAEIERHRAAEYQRRLQQAGLVRN